MQFCRSYDCKAKVAHAEGCATFVCSYSEEGWYRSYLLSAGDSFVEVQQVKFKLHTAKLVQFKRDCWTSTMRIAEEGRLRLSSCRNFDTSSAKFVENRHGEACRFSTMLSTRLSKFRRRIVPELCRVLPSQKLRFTSGACSERSERASKHLRDRNFCFGRTLHQRGVPCTSAGTLTCRIKNCTWRSLCNFCEVVKVPKKDVGAVSFDESNRRKSCDLPRWLLGCVAAGPSNRRGIATFVSIRLVDCERLGQPQQVTHVEAKLHTAKLVQFREIV